MPEAPNVLDKARALLDERRNELKRELHQIEGALSKLDGSARRGPGRPRGSTSSAATTAPRKRRRRRGGTRADQAAKIIAASPGISASDIAKQMKIKPNYVYRVMGELQADGKISKKGKGYHPA